MRLTSPNAPLFKPLVAVGFLFTTLFSGVVHSGQAVAQEESDGGWVTEDAAKSIAQIDATGVGVSLEQESESVFLITIDLQGSSGLGEKRPQVFTIAKPTRLVVDLPGLQSGNGSAAVPQKDGAQSVVSGLRLGAHAEKARLVVDLTSDEVPTYRVKREGGFILVRFSVAPGELPPKFADGEEIEPVRAKEPEVKAARGSTAEESPDAVERVIAAPDEPHEHPVAEPLQIEAAPQEQPTAAKTPTPGVASTVLAANDGKPPVQEPVTSDQLGPVPSASVVPESGSEVPKPAEGKTVVRGIYYQTTSNSQVPAVVFDASGLATYSLNKQKPDVYELVLKNSSLGGRHLTLPQFPPDSFQGFNVIVARQQGNDVVIKVYVEENVKLFPFIAKQQLWLKASR